MDLDDIEEALGPVYPLARQVEVALEGAVYPLTRREVVLVARANEAPPTLLSLLEGIRDARFRSLDDVQQALSPPPPPPGPDPAPPAADRPPASR